MRNLLFIVLAMASLSLQLSAKTSEPVFFNILELFGSEDLTQIDPEVKSRLQSEIQTIIEHGGSPVGIAPVWVFPKSLGAPRVPPNNFASFEGVEPVRINCIPDFKADEYRKWSAARDRVFAALAAHFPEVTEWLVGFEPDQHVFCDCSGRQLGFEQYVRFAVDSLIGIRKAVKTANPHNSTIAHFLGSRGRRLRFGDRLVQPREVSDQISTEIQNRGNSSLDCFDQSVISLEPALAVDRAEEKSVLVNLQSAALYEPWNIFWIEYFDTSAVDLVSDYSGRWVKTLTDERTESNPEGSIRLTGTPVSGGLAHVSNASYPWACNRYAYREGGYKLACSSIGGARSNVDVTPDQLFPIYISGITERNKWTVVLDYYVEQTPTGTDNHNPVFLRVNDRPCPGPNCWWLPADAVLYRWNGVAMEPTPPYSNQTRFGALVFRRDPGSTGALQFQGDSLVQGETGSYRYHLPPIQLNEEPFENPEGRLFRNQIVEEEHLTWGYPPIFELQWRAEFWDLTNGRLLNTQDPPVWFTEYTVKNVYGIKIPDMPGSRIMMGLGPGNGGQYGADLIGTAYWVN